MLPCIDSLLCYQLICLYTKLCYLIHCRLDEAGRLPGGHSIITKVLKKEKKGQQFQKMSETEVGMMLLLLGTLGQGMWADSRKASLESAVLVTP